MIAEFISGLQDKMPDEAGDIRLNLETVLTEEGSPGLTRNQIYATALASAYSTRMPELIETIRRAGETVLSPEETKAAKAAAIIMAMNNVYYRSVHLAEDPGLQKMPARLRMNVIGKPGVPKVDFELYCTAVSAINGCGMCLKAHIHELRKAGVEEQGVQSSLRIAAVINASAHALSLS